MKSLYALTASFLITPAIGAMDRPRPAAAGAQMQMSESERKDVIAWAQQYVRDNNPSFFQNLVDHVNEHKKLRFNDAPLPDLTSEQIKERDKITFDKFGRIQLTQREKVDMGISDDPRILEAAERDPYTVFSRKLEQAGASDGLIAQVMLAREQELKNNPHKDPYMQMAHPAYNTSMRQIEDNSKIHERDFDDQLGVLCTQKAAGKSLDLTFDDAGDLITTRVFLYKKLPQDQLMRAAVGNLDSARLSNMVMMAQELQLNFNKPRQDGQLPINVALAHGRYQAASMLVAGAFDEQAFPNGPVNLKLNAEQLTKNPLLITLVSSLKKSIELFANSKNPITGKVEINHAIRRYLKTEGLLLAYYMLEHGLPTELPAGLPDPIKYADDNGFGKIASLISLAKSGNLKPRSELLKDSPALKLVAQEIASTDEALVKEHVEPYRLI